MRVSIENDGTMLEDYVDYTMVTSDIPDAVIADAEQEHGEVDRRPAQKKHARSGPLPRTILSPPGEDDTPPPKRLRRTRQLKAAQPQATQPTKKAAKPATRSSVRASTKSSKNEVKPATRQRRDAVCSVRKTQPDLSEKEWEVEKIVGSQINAVTREHFYCVKWAGFASKHNTWETKENLAQCRAAIQDFERQNRKTD